MAFVITAQIVLRMSMVRSYSSAPIGELCAVLYTVGNFLVKLVCIWPDRILVPQLGSFVQFRTLLVTLGNFFPYMVRSDSSVPLEGFYVVLYNFGNFF